GVLIRQKVCPSATKLAVHLWTHRCIVKRLPFFFSSRRRHTSWPRDWSSDVCSSDLIDTAVDPVLESFCEEWGKETPLVLIAEGLEDEHGKEAPQAFPRGTREEDAKLRLIVDPIDGTRGLMYDKRSAWALAGVAPNKGPGTRLRDIEVSLMTELPTSKMGHADVLWAIKGQGAHGERIDLSSLTS